MATIRAAIRKHAPWDSAVDFATHPSFCGSRLYPRQHTLLKLIFLETEQMSDYDLGVIEGWRGGFTRHRDVFGVQPDIWERIAYLKSRGARRFPHIQFIGGRRGSKGLMGGILGTEQIAYFHSLDDWQRHYGVDAGKDGYMQIGATSQTQAKDQLFADIRSTVERCQYLHPYIAETKDHILSIRTPADIRRIGDMKAAGVTIDHLVATLKVQALSSQSAAGRGATAFGIMLDEFAFMLQTGGSRDGSSIYEDWAPSLDQFDLDGLMYVPSSPHTKSGRCYSLYQQGSVLMDSYADREGGGEAAAAELKKMAAEQGTELDEVHADPTMLIIHLPSWGAYEDWERGPSLVGIRFKRPIQPGPDHESQRRRKLRNPEKFAVERNAQWAEVMGAYFDADMVDRIFHAPTWRSPLEAQGRGYLDRKYRIHCDPGRTGANFALCIGHTEDMCPSCGWTPQQLGQALMGPQRHPQDCPNPRMRPHVVIDLLHVWQPKDFPPDPETGKPTIDYVQVREDIEGLLRAFPSTTKISFDQWNCLSADTLISTDRGQITIKEFVGDDLGVGEIRPGHGIVESRGGSEAVGQMFRKGVADTLRFTTWSGAQIECTPEHRLWVRGRSAESEEERRRRGVCLHCGEPQPVLAKTGKARLFCSGTRCGYTYRRHGIAFDLPRWKEAAQIGEGDELYRHRGGIFPEEHVQLPPFEIYNNCSRVPAKSYVDEDLAAFLGYIVSEGNVSDSDGGIFNFCQKDPEVIEDFAGLCEASLGYRPADTVRTHHTKTKGTTQTTSSRIYSMPLLRALGKDEMCLPSTQKITPSVILRSPRKVVCSYLSALFEGDGGITPDGISYWSLSERLIRETQQLLLTLGIFSRIRCYAPSRTKGTHPRWVLTASGPEAIRFCEEIGFRSSRKKEQARLHVASLKSGRSLGAKRDRFMDGDAVRDAITGIESSRTECYDLSVPTTECYIAGGFVSHNSAGMIAELRRSFSPSIRVAEVTFTEKENQSRCEKVKSALNLGWISSYTDTFGPDGSCLLEQEMKYLSVRAGKVVKQSIGPIVTKDLFDSFAVVVTDLLHNELERYGSGGNNLSVGVFGSTNVAALQSGREQARLAAADNGNSRAAENRARLASLRESGRPKYVPSRASSIRPRRG